MVGEWGGPMVGKDRQWQDAFSRFLLSRRLSSIYWSLNPNSEDTGGLLMDDWTTPHGAKLSLLRGHTGTKLAAFLAGQPSFRCPQGPIPPHMHRCADSSAGECIFAEQLCNGVYECRDRSDEWACHGRQRPCSTVSGGRWGQLCVFPFNYNGFTYDTCTLVDAMEAWTLVGQGRCQRGYIPSLAASGISLTQCQEACTRTANCTLISYSHTQAFCGIYTAACAGTALHAGVGGYVTYRFNEDGGAWCATAVGEHGEYLGRAAAGICGPGCARPKLAGEASRSRCMDNGVHSDGGPAHCAPSPPPPPRSPPPPNVPPHVPPPSPPPPPAAPPPWLTSVLLMDPMGLFLLALVATCVLCTCWARVRQSQLAPRSSARRRRTGRPLYAEELQSLASVDEPSGPFRTRRMPPPKRAACGRRDDVRPMRHSNPPSRAMPGPVMYRN